MRGSREISLVPSLHRASTDALINNGTVQIELLCVGGNPEGLLLHPSLSGSPKYFYPSC